jgi:hypothetical protein
LELVFDREVSSFSGKAREGSLLGQVTDQATQRASGASTPEDEQASEENQCQ